MEVRVIRLKEKEKGDRKIGPAASQFSKVNTEEMNPLEYYCGVA
ncbi:hypothetical protein J40TS1_37740 [Paenibacillus montaniterrae]|uniref:Uncharacterized protein n=1 Tax=Paenibacillus montaniterrae TaxID=429341 RepID=A0A919YRY8_9BACL|nr:hypothetical protein J40TS1_37740 [Paenibacillus montaniterrae]